MKLVSDSWTYEVTYKDSEEEDEGKHPVFTLRKLSAAQVNEIDDRVTKTSMGKNASVQFLAGTARRLKIAAAVVGWTNVHEEDGTDAKCSATNKEKLPAAVQAFLEDEVNEKNNLSGVEEDERKN